MSELLFLSLTIPGVLLGAYAFAFGPGSKHFMRWMWVLVFSGAYVVDMCVIASSLSRGGPILGWELLWGPAFAALFMAMTLYLNSPFNNGDR